MLPRALLAAALAAVCVYEVCDAIPSTSLRRTHTLRASNSGLYFSGQRRVRDTQDQLTTPSPLQTTSPPLGQYFANYSLVGQEIECSDAAKRCLAINRLLHEPSGMCYELGDYFPCREVIGSLDWIRVQVKLILDAESFRQGQLRSRCSELHSLTALNMAFDGRSYHRSDILEKLCIGSKEIMFHPLGGFECKLPYEMFERVKKIRQPKTPGRCIIPNLQNADIGPFLVQCSTEEEKCLKKNLLPFGGGCYSPLSNTPCPEGQWLVLDEDAAESGRLIAKCNSSQPCGSDAQLLRADQACHADEELLKILCNPDEIFPLPTGEYICSVSGKKYEILGSKKENGLCRIIVSPGTDKPTIGILGERR